MHDLAIITVSTNEARWLRTCLRTVFEHAGDISLDVVVADNESTDGTSELVADEFPKARVVRCRNRGFAHGNNRALLTTDARYVLFLNPDTETIEGTYESLVRAMDERPTVGLIGVRQLDGDRVLFPTIRWFPSPVRAFAQSLGGERWGRGLGRWTGERELDMHIYEEEVECDWTSGSFMLARREALESAGAMDERFFIYCEEPDLCSRIKQAGWSVRHLPLMTIVHYAGKGGVSPKMESQDAYARRQYAQKHFPPAKRYAYLAGVGTGLALRAAFAAPDRKVASKQALRTLVGLAPPPFGPPPEQALAIRGTTTIE